MLKFRHGGSGYRFILQLCMLWLCCVSMVWSAADLKPLLPTQAYKFSAVVKKQNQIDLSWKIAPGYYLYASKFAFSFSPAVQTTYTLPQAMVKPDLMRGHISVYTGMITIPVKLIDPPQRFQLTVHYQGCSQHGFCYPPQQQTISFNLAAKSNSNIGNAIALSTLDDQNAMHALISAEHPLLTFLIFMLVGLLLAFTPCVLPMVPIVTALVVGQQHKLGTGKAFILALIYVLGMAITYAMAGVAAASLGSSLQVWLQKPIIIVSVSLLFVLLALALFDVYHIRLSPQLQNRFASWSSRHEGGTYVGVFFMGVLSTLVVSPCITAPLVGVLLYIGDTGNVLFGAFALFAIALGMGIPLILAGMSAHALLPKAGSWMQVIKEIFGILMLAMAAWMLSRILSDVLTTIMWGALIIGSAVYVGFYLPRHVGQQKLNRLVGVSFAVVGVIVMLGGVSVPHMLNQYLHTADAEKNEHIISVRSLAELQQQLAYARAQHKPVLLDFYADWCESCKDMDKKVFASAEVQTALHGFVVLRADVSALTPDTEALMQRYGVIAPPTVIFFTDQGQFVSTRRLVGDVGHKEFLAFMNMFMQASCTRQVQC